MVQNWLEHSAPVTVVKAEQPPMLRAEVESGAVAPPTLPMHPWINQTAEKFWNQFQDEVMQKVEKSIVEVEPRLR